MAKLKYTKQKMAKYLTSHKFNNRKRRLIFKIRTRMVKVNENFGIKSICQVCKDPNSEDSQSHAILSCTKINNVNSVNNGIKYEDIFTENINGIEEVVSKAETALRRRKLYLSKKEN